MKVNIQKRLLPFFLSLVLLVTVIFGNAVFASADDSVSLYGAFSFNATGDSGYSISIPRPSYMCGNYIYIALRSNDLAVSVTADGIASTVEYQSGKYTVLKVFCYSLSDSVTKETVDLVFHSDSWVDVYKVFAYPIYSFTDIPSGWQYRKNVTIKPITDTSSYMDITSFPKVVSDSASYYVYDLRISASSLTGFDFFYVPLNISGFSDYDVLPFSVEVFLDNSPVEFEVTNEFYGNTEGLSEADYSVGIKVPVKSSSGYYYIRFIVVEPENKTMDFSIYTPVGCISNLPTTDDYIRWMYDDIGDILEEVQTSNNFLQNIWNAIVSGFQSIVNWFSTLISKLTSWFQTIFDKIDNLIDVIKNGTPEQQAVASEVQQNVSSAVGGLNSAGQAMDSVSGAEIDSNSLIPSDLQSDVYLAYTACISKAWDSQVLTSMLGILMSLILISYVFHGKKEG